MTTAAAQSMATAAFRALATYGTYTANSVSVPAYILIERRAESVSFESSAIERRHYAHMLIDEVGYPDRGDTVTVSGSTYELQDVLYDDGVVIRMSAKA